MPLVTFNTIEGALSAEEKKQLTDNLTSAVIDVVGEKMKPHTWVIINESPEGSFSVGGHALTPEIYQRAKSAGKD